MRWKNEGEVAIGAVGASHDWRVGVIAIYALARSARCRWCRWMTQCRWCRDLFFLSPSLSLSLSLLFSKAGSHLKWKWKRKWFSVVLALIFGQLEMLFSLIEFEVTTKHPISQKIISGISLKSIQTQPKVLWVTCQRHGKCCQWKCCHLSKTWKINIFLITVFIYFYWMGYSILFIYKN